VLAECLCDFLADFQEQMCFGVNFDGVGQVLFSRPVSYADKCINERLLSVAAFVCDYFDVNIHRMFSTNSRYRVSLDDTLKPRSSALAS